MDKRTVTKSFINSLVYTALLAGLALGCQGPKGDSGSEGPQGPSGAKGLDGADAQIVPMNEAQGGFSGAGGFVGPEHHIMVRETKKFLVGLFELLSDEALKGLPGGWDKRQKFIDIINDVRLRPKDGTPRKVPLKDCYDYEVEAAQELNPETDHCERTLLMDYGNDPDGTPWVAFKERFFYEDVAPLIENDDFANDKLKYARRILHEIAHHIPGIEEDDVLSEAFAVATMQALLSELYVCVSKDEVIWEEVESEQGNSIEFKNVSIAEAMKNLGKSISGEDWRVVRVGKKTSYEDFGLFRPPAQNLYQTYVVSLSDSTISEQIKRLTDNARSLYLQNHTFDVFDSWFQRYDSIFDGFRRMNLVENEYGGWGSEFTNTTATYTSTWPYPSGDSDFVVRGQIEFSVPKGKLDLKAYKKAETGVASESSPVKINSRELDCSVDTINVSTHMHEILPILIEHGHFADPTKSRGK